MSVMASVEFPVILFYFLGFHYLWYFAEGTNSQGLEVGIDQFESLTLHHRSKKQTRNCSLEQWTCSNGACISLDQLCDGRTDCTDRSDETTLACAEFDCPAYLFRCDYGACVDADAKCNGVLDCSDATDEHPSLCSDRQPAITSASSTTTTSIFMSESSAVKESSGSQAFFLYEAGGSLLNKENLVTFSYTGTISEHDITKTSPQTPTLTTNTTNIFPQEVTATAHYDNLIVYGSEVYSTEKYSDSENPGMEYSSSVSSDGGYSEAGHFRNSCLLPPYPVNGYYVALSSGFPGDRKTFVQLYNTCDEGYDLIWRTRNQCFMGNWELEDPVCERKCKPLPILDAECFILPNMSLVRCDLPQRSRTIVTVKCKNKNDEPIQETVLDCVDGKWDKDIPSCSKTLDNYRTQLELYEQISTMEGENEYNKTFANGKINVKIEGKDIKYLNVHIKSD